MEETKVQWHPGFVAAMNLELAEDRDSLIFEKEYNLNTKPLEIDLLVIKKAASVRIGNEIGALFRGHNIMEYKSPRDALDIDAFYKAGAYASLYKSYGATLDAVRAEDVTVSLVREARPDGLLRYFREHGYMVSKPYSGIYYIKSNVLFPERVEKLSGKEEREFADSVLEVSVGANRQVIEELRGDGRMCQALMEIMEPELLLKKQEGLKEGLKKGISGTVETLREFGHGDLDIKNAIMQRYELTAEEAEKYLCEEI